MYVSPVGMPAGEYDKLSLLLSPAGMLISLMNIYVF